MKAVLERGPNWGHMSADKREALHMISHKLSRIVCGKSDFKDTWVDISGYATLISRNITD